MREELVEHMDPRRPGNRCELRLELALSDELWPRLTTYMHELRREVKEDFYQKRIYQ